MAVCDFFGDGSALALYQLDDTPNDECGNVDGVWNGTEQYIAGKFDNAANFDGSSFINLEGLISNGSNFAISLFVQQTPETNQTYIGHANASHAFVLDCSSSTEVRVLVGNGTQTLMTTNIVPSNTTWTHYVISHQDGENKLYANNSLEDSVSKDWDYDSDSIFTVGSRYNGNTIYPLIGSIDHIRVFNRELSDAEVTELFNESTGEVPSTIDDFVASDDLCNGVRADFTPATGNPVPTHDIYIDNILWHSNIAPGDIFTASPGSTWDFHIIATNSEGDTESNHNTGSVGNCDIVDFTASDDRTDGVLCNWTYDKEPDETYLRISYDGNDDQIAGVSPGYIYTDIEEGQVKEFFIRTYYAEENVYLDSNHDTGTITEEISSIPMFGSIAIESAMYGAKTVECLYYGSKQVWCASKVPMPIADFNASDDLESGVVCTWTDNGDVDTFNLYRDGTSIATDVDSGYEDMTGTAGTMYIYNVEACNVDGCIDSNVDDGLMIAPAYTYCGVVFNGEFDTDLYGWVDSNTNMNPIHGEDENGGYVEIAPGDQPYETYLSNNEDNLGDFNPKANTEYTLTTISDNSTLYGFGVMYFTTSKAIIFDKIADGGTETVTYTFPADTDESRNANVYIFADEYIDGNTFKIHKVCFVEGDTSVPYPPTEITDFNASDTREDGVRCTWSNASGNPMPTYNLFRGGSSIATDVSSGYVDSVGPGTYTYFVRAINSEGLENSNEDEGTVIDSGTGNPPSTITDFNASDDIEDYIECTWSDATNADRYDLYRGTSRIAIDVSSGYQDSNAPVGNTYTYYVRAINDDGYTNSNEDTGIRPENVNEEPPTITYFEARENDTRHVGIYWSGFEGVPEATCEIYRDDVLIDTEMYKRHYYADDTAVPNVVYTYYIKAINNAGEITSPTDEGMRLPEVVPPPTELPCDDSIDCDSMVEC